MCERNFNINVFVNEYDVLVYLYIYDLLMIRRYYEGSFLSNCIDETVFHELSSNIDEGCSSNI